MTKGELMRSLAAFADDIEVFVYNPAEPSHERQVLTLSYQAAHQSRDPYVSLIVGNVALPLPVLNAPGGGSLRLVREEPELEGK